MYLKRLEMFRIDLSYYFSARSRFPWDELISPAKFLFKISRRLRKETKFHRRFV